MGKSNRLASVFNVETGEGRLVILLLIYSFFIGFARLLVSTSAGTLLRDRFGADAASYLPYIYIGSAIVAPATGYLYSRLEDKLSFSKLLTANFGFLLVTITGFYVLLFALPDAGWPAIAFYIWYYVLYALIMLAFWGLATKLLDIRQSKRLFGLIGSGMVVAMIISGFLVRPLVSLIGPFNLLLLAASGIFLSLVLMLYITRAFQTDRPAPRSSRRGKAAEAGKGYSELLKDRYIVLIVAITALNLVAYFFIDNAFYDQVYIRFPEPDELASFLGEFLAVSSIFNLGSRMFASGKLITRYGLLVGLLTLPLALFASSLLVAVVGTVMGFTPLLFWLVVFTRLLFRVIGDAVDKPSFSILYQALPTAQRMRVQTLVISIVEPIGGGIAGVILLLLSFNSVQIFYAVLIFLLGWVVAAALVSRQYRRVLLDGLSQNKLGEISLDALDKSSLAILEQQTKSAPPAVVFYSLTVLEAVHHGTLTRALRRALSHPSPEVRQDALARIERLGLMTMARDVRLRINFEPSTVVKAAALRTLASLGDDDIFDEVAPYLDDSNLDIKKGAMVGLLRSGGIEGILMAGEKLIRLIDSPNAVEREFAVTVLGDVNQPSFYRPLLRLLNDDSPRVQRAALGAAGKLRNAKLWPLVLTKLDAPLVRSAAVSALVAAGPTALPALAAVLANENVSTEKRIRIARICGQIGSDEAANMLETQLNYPDNDVRYQVLVSLRRCNYQAPAEKIAAVQQQIEAEVENAVWLLASLEDVGQHQFTTHLYKALTDEIDQTRDRVFLLLSFVYEAQNVQNVQRNLAQPDRSKRAYALEVLENMLTTRRSKDILLPLMDDSRLPEQQLSLLHPLFPSVNLKIGRYKRLQDIFARPTEWISPWGRACALLAMVQLLETPVGATTVPTPKEVQRCIDQALEAGEPLLRETALFSISYTQSLSQMGKIKKLTGDENPVVAAVATQLASRGEITMQSTIEKVMLLKSIDIFTEVPEETLATVAMNLDEVSKQAGEAILHKGDMGHSMYIIAEGQVKIHDGDKLIRYVESPEIFGELSALDADPHTASVTAETDTLLYLLDQDILYELMADHVEVAQGIIKVLTRRVRVLTQDISTPAAQSRKTVKEAPKDVLMGGILDKLSD